jgi:signal transduction histidine kinase
VLASRSSIRRLRLDPVRFDYALAAVLLVAGLLQTWLGNGTTERVPATIVGPLVALTVAFRRRHPAAAGFIAQGLVALQYTLWGGIDVIPYSIAWFCSLYGLTVWTSRNWFVAGLAFVAVTDLVSLVGPDSSVHSTVPFLVVTLVVMILVRSVVGNRERRAQLAERERDLAAREAVVEERARIARELHDVIAHNVSMVVVQAGAERRVLGEESESTREVLATIEHIGRGALTEMRRLVGMLRAERDEPLAPQPGLDDLPRLVTQVREAGLPVELHVEGDRRAFPVGIELSAYRIVQEALTNALKHAGDAHAAVHVRYGAEALEVEVSDDGPGNGANGAGGGHGLVGMRERVALYGGRFEAGHDPSGGFVVRATLPAA